MGDDSPEAVRWAIWCEPLPGYSERGHWLGLSDKGEQPSITFPTEEEAEKERRAWAGGRHGRWYAFFTLRAP